jgi:hypothetical protein
MPEINELYAYLTDNDGQRFQVLKLDDAGEPVAWDESATYAAFHEANPTG